jgi:hypothetical protein
MGLCFFLVYLLDSFSSPHLERVERVLLGGEVGGKRDVSERHRLCSRWVNSASFRLPRVMKKFRGVVFDGNDC